jgi:hypothetical protein
MAMSHGASTRKGLLASVPNGSRAASHSSGARPGDFVYESNASASRARLQAHRVPARRAINSDATKRGGVLEFIISNVTPRD